MSNVPNYKGFILLSDYDNWLAFPPAAATSEPTCYVLSTYVFELRVELLRMVDREQRRRERRTRNVGSRAPPHARTAYYHHNASVCL